MPTTSPPGFRLGALRPQDAINAFAQRDLLRPSFRWQDVWQAEHARAFAVAGVLRLDVLGLMREQMAAAVAEGTDMRSFVRKLREQLVAKGFWGGMEITDPATGELRRVKFNEARLRLIFDVNMRQSHAAGAWARLQRGRMPYLVYRTMRDEKVRASHRLWDNLVLPRDHSFWDTHYPPNGWRCRCLAFAIDEKGLQRLKEAAPADAPVRTEAPPERWVEFVNRSTGQTERVPHGIDPGFGYNPGKLHVQRGVELLERGLAAVGPTTPGAGDALAVMRAVVARTRREAGFAAFLKSPPPQAVGMPVAALPGIGAEPSIASVAAQALRDQADALARGTSGYPPALPTNVAHWALAQAIIDRGARLDLADGRALWWWTRGQGAEQRVLLLVLQRSPLVWWVQELQTLTRAEALQRYPMLERLLAGPMTGGGNGGGPNG